MDQQRVESFAPGELETHTGDSSPIGVFAETRAFFLSSIGVAEPHENIGVMMVGAEDNSPTPTFEQALARLVESAKREGADGLVYIGFHDHRSRRARVCRIDQETTASMAVLAWGTMIKLRPKDEN